MFIGSHSWHEAKQQLTATSAEESRNWLLMCHPPTRIPAQKTRFAFANRVSLKTSLNIIENDIQYNNISFAAAELAPAPVPAAEDPANVTTALLLLNAAIDPTGTLANWDLQYQLLHLARRYMQCARGAHQPVSLYPALACYSELSLAWCS